MSILARLIDQFDGRMRSQVTEEQAVSAGFMREPSGIGTSKHNVEPHPSSAPYPYIIDAGHATCTPDGACKCYPDGNWDPGQ